MIFLYVTIPEYQEKLRNIIFYYKEHTDPSPKPKRNEDTLDYYKRIGYKYSLRISRYHYLHYLHEVEQSRLFLEWKHYSKKQREAGERYADWVEYVANVLKEDYETVLVRKRVEEEMNGEG